MKPFRLALCLIVSFGWSACGGGKGGGGGDPPLRPNDPPVLQVPSGLSGTSPRYTFTLPIAGAQTLIFAATDPDGDPLLWQIGVPGAAAATVGAVFTSPLTGSTFTLQIQPVAAAAAAPLILLVEDPRGNAASIDLLIVRTGAPSISAVAPDSAFVGQPQVVTVTGSALRLAGAANTVARFDGLAGTGTVLVDETTLLCATPGPAVAGPTVVSVGNQFGTAALPASAFTIYAYPPNFLPTDQRLDAGTASALHMVRDGSAIHAVWLEGSAVVYRRSVDRGVTWDPSQMLSGVAAGSEPQVLVLGQDVSVTWIGNGTSVWFARSIDGGSTFQAAVRLDTNGAPGTPRSRPRLAQSGDRRHATWLAGDATVGTARVLATASADRGAVWTAPVLVSDALANQGQQEITADGAVALILFEDARLGASLRGIYVVRSTDGGGSWGTARRLNLPTIAAGQPRLAAAGARVHCCWLQNDALFYTASPDHGASWNTTVSQVQSPQAGAVSAPAICAEADRVFLGYVVAGNAVWVSRYSPIGSTLQHTLVDSAIAVSAETQIGCAGNYVFVAWREGDLPTGAARIQQAVSGDRGATFPAPAGLGNGAAAQTGAQLLHDGARLLLGWLDSRDPTAGVFVNRTAQ